MDTLTTPATGRPDVLPVLMYHGLHDGPQDAGRFDPVYSVRPSDFAAQLDWLCEHGYAGVGLEGALERPASDTRRPVLITFDDGDVSNLTVAVPLLRERGMSAEFFITSGFVGQAGMLGEADVRALADAGMGIGSHGRSHAFLEDLPAGQMHAELRDSRDFLGDLAGRAITSLALPGGRGGERERRAALALGYRHLFGSRPGPNRRPQPGAWWQRLAMTRDTTLDEFGALVRWSGLRPRLAQTRFLALALPKRVLGNRGYERLRARLL